MRAKRLNRILAYGLFPEQLLPENFKMATIMATFCRVGPLLTNRSRVVAFRDDARGGF